LQGWRREKKVNKERAGDGGEDLVPQTSEGRVCVSALLHFLSGNRIFPNQ